MPRGWTPRRGNQLTALKLPKLLQENSEPLKLIKETLEVEKNPAPAIRKYAFETIIKNILGIRQEHLQGSSGTSSRKS